MCGRFARYSLSRELERYFNAHPSNFEIQPNYNVAPTQEIPVVVIYEDERHIKKRHWQLGIGAVLGQGHFYRLSNDQRNGGNRNL